MKIRAALYARVSTAAQTEKWGLSTQRDALAAHAAREGWEIVEKFEDAGISGETLTERPAMLRLLEGVRAGRFDVVCAVEFERFSRSRHGRDWSEILSACEDGRAKLATLTQTLDAANPDDGFLGGLFGLLSARERRKTMERTRKGRRARAADGKWAVGVAPFGYRVGDSGRLEIVDEDAAVVRSIFAAVRDGSPLAHVATDLNARGVRPPGRSKRGGRVWRPVAIKRMIENETYMGRLVYGNRTHAAGTDLVVVEDAHPAIIDPREYARVVGLVAARKAQSFPRSHWDSGFILTGILKCATCGHGMQGKGSPHPRHPERRRQRSYICTHGRYLPDAPRCATVNAYAAEDAVCAELARALSVPGVLMQVRREAVGELLRDATEDSRRRADLEGQIAQSEQRVRMLYEDRVAGLLSPVQFGEFNAAELAKQANARTEIRAVEDRLLALGGHADVEAVVARLADVGRVLGALTPAERKMLLAETVSAIRATRREDGSLAVQIDYRLPGLGAAPAATPAALAASA